MKTNNLDLTKPCGGDKSLYKYNTNFIYVFNFGEKFPPVYYNFPIIFYGTINVSRSVSRKTSIVGGTVTRANHPV